MKMSLYEIDQKIDEAMDAIDWETGDILDEELADKLQDLKMDRREKLENIALYIIHLLQYREAVISEIRKLTGKKKVLDNKIDRLKKYLAEALGGDTIKTPRVNVTFRKSTSLVFSDNFDEEKFIKDFWDWDFIIKSYTIDKKGTRAHFREWSKLPKEKGVVNYHGIEEVVKQNIQIK